MTHVTGFDLGPLRSAMQGTVLGPGDADYDTARALWNGDIDKRPIAFARVAGPDDVAAALAFAREHALEISVRGGGHAVNGTALSDGGLTIDLSALVQVMVDAQARTARVGGGAALGQLDAATQAHGLAVPAGVISHTGVAGLTLGGGMGWLTHMHGLSIDNLVSAEVVVADGRRDPRVGAPIIPTCSGRCAAGAGTSAWSPSSSSDCTRSDPRFTSACSSGDSMTGPAALRLCRDFVATIPERSAVLIAA